MIDGQVSDQLIRNIFFPKAALHDGAMIIRDGRITAAGCVLPLSESNRISADLGTRHRAGVGMSEVSDAVVVIVSEETGTWHPRRWSGCCGVNCATRRTVRKIIWC